MTTRPNRMSGSSSWITTRSGTMWREHFRTVSVDLLNLLYCIYYDYFSLKKGNAPKPIVEERMELSYADRAKLPSM